MLCLLVCVVWQCSPAAVPGRLFCRMDIEFVRALIIKESYHDKSRLKPAAQPWHSNCRLVPRWSPPTCLFHMFPCTSNVAPPSSASRPSNALPALLNASIGDLQAKYISLTDSTANSLSVGRAAKRGLITAFACRVAAWCSTKPNSPVYRVNVHQTPPTHKLV